MTKGEGGAENPKEAEGRKKVQLQLVPPAAIHEMALALQCGADKYGAWNWRGAGINLMTYLGAMRRHIDAILTGENFAPDSKVSHIGHILAGAAIVADAASVGMLTDDRPGVVSARERALARVDELKAKADRLRMAMIGAADEVDFKCSERSVDGVLGEEYRNLADQPRPAPRPDATEAHFMADVVPEWDGAAPEGTE